MKKHDTSTFFKTFTGTFFWILGLITVIAQPAFIPTILLLKIALVSLISATIFGILYKAIWSTHSLNNLAKIAISAFINLSGGLAVIYLLFPSHFITILHWSPLMLRLNLVIHFVTATFHTVN